MVCGRLSFHKTLEVLIVSIWSDIFRYCRDFLNPGGVEGGLYAVI